MKYQSEEIIEYEKIDLNPLSAWLPSASTTEKKELLSIILKNVLHKKYVLLIGGTPSVFLAELIIVLSKRIGELAFKKSEKEKGFVIYSMYSEESFLRPFDISFLKTNANEEIHKEESDISLHIDALSDMYGEDVYSHIYSIEPKKKRVKIYAKTQTLPFLIALIHFRLFAKELYMNDIRII